MLRDGFLHPGIKTAQVLALGLCLLSACAGSNHERRGSLGDAMSKASDHNSGSRETETSPPPPSFDHHDSDDDQSTEGVVVAAVADALTDSNSAPIDSDANSDDQMAMRSDELAMTTDTASGPVLRPAEHAAPSTFNERIALTISGGSGLLRGDDYFGLNTFELGIGAFAEKRSRIVLHASYSHAPLQETSALSQSLKSGASLLEAGGAFQYFTTSQHTLMGQYFEAGFDYVYMMWSYRNAITADEYDDDGNVIGTETIDGDALKGYDFHLGAGWNLIQSRSFDIGGVVRPGVIVWQDITHEGFENDVFETFWYLKIAAVLNISVD